MPNLSPGGRLVLAVSLVPLGAAAMLWDIIGSSHNDWTLEQPWFFGSTALVMSAALSLTSIVPVRARNRDSRPWWLFVAYALCLFAGGLGIWGLSVPVLDRIG